MHRHRSVYALRSEVNCLDQNLYLTIVKTRIGCSEAQERSFRMYKKRVFTETNQHNMRLYAKFIWSKNRKLTQNRNLFCADRDRNSGSAIGDDFHFVIIGFSCRPYSRCARCVAAACLFLEFLLDGLCRCIQKRQIKCSGDSRRSSDIL